MSNQALNAVPNAGRQNRGVLTRISLSFMPDRARIQNVRQQPPQRVQGKRAAGTESTRFARPAFKPPAPALDFRERKQYRTLLFKQRKDSAHLFSFFLVHHQTST